MDFHKVGHLLYNIRHENNWLYVAVIQLNVKHLRNLAFCYPQTLNTLERPTLYFQLPGHTK